MWLDGHDSAFCLFFFKLDINWISTAQGLLWKTLLVSDLNRQVCFEGHADEKCTEEKEGFMWGDSKTAGGLFCSALQLDLFICFIPFLQSQHIIQENVWFLLKSLQSGKYKLWSIMTSIKDDAFTRLVRESLQPYLLPAQQTATAPEDVPWLLRTGRAQWPRAETHVNKSIYAHAWKIYKHLQHAMFTQA